MAHSYNPGSTVQRGDEAEAMREKAAENNSRRLLVAQIRTGQHALVGDALIERVAELRAGKWL